MGSCLGAVLGAVDQSYFLVKVFAPRRPRFFADGWGDVRSPHEGFADLARRVEACSCEGALDKLEATLTWEAPKNPRACAATFESPAHDRLPEKAKRARFTLVCPEADDVDRPWRQDADAPRRAPPAVVLLLPATGEQGSSGRLKIAEDLARDLGACSIVLTAPFYAARRPPDQQAHFVRTVEGFLRQSLAIMQESALLLCWCAKRWPGVPICTSGFSWGAAMGAAAALIASQWAPPETRILTVPYAGSGTPAVLVDGLLEDDVEWSALRGEGETKAEVRERLLRLLLDINTVQFTDVIVAARRERLVGVHSVSFRNDGFVNPSYAEDFFRNLCSVTADGAANRHEWHGGGHARAFFSKGRLQRDAIEAALSRSLAAAAAPK